MEQTYSTKQIIISLFIVVAVILAFYGITVVLTNNKEKETSVPNDSNEAVIQYDEIIVGEIFNQSESEYYVLAYNDNSNSQEYISNLNTYSELEGATKSYEIDLTNAFNKKYVSSESDFEGQFPIFSETTLVKVVNKQIVETYTGTDINTQIENMTKSIKE